jgi:D-alanyl-D-alanine carboxypeptidase
MPLRSFASAVLASGLLFAVPAMAAFDELGELEKVGARVSAVVIDLGNLSVIAERNAEIRLTPASLTKLSIAAASLEAWPADKAFHTRLLSTAPLQDGVLSGTSFCRATAIPRWTITCSGASLRSSKARVLPRCAASSSSMRRRLAR